MQTEMKRNPIKVTLSPPTIPGHTYCFAVDTPKLTIHPGDELEFHFIGCKNPTIMIPVGKVMTRRITVAHEKEPGIVRLRVLSNPDMTQKSFAYAVYSPDIDDFATGNSPPRMVLEPKPGP